MLIFKKEKWHTWFYYAEGKAQLEELYGSTEDAGERYLNVFDKFCEAFGYEECAFFSAPGRTELSGNHTDHQHGYVLAGAVSLDMVAAVLPRKDKKVRIVSEGYPMTEIELDNLSPVEAEKNTTAALVRGIAAGFAERRFGYGGFDAYIDSNIPIGSGLSSSAAIEVLLGTIMNVIYNNGNAYEASLAVIGQYAENDFFGKPSGLMDQMSIACGGVSFIDFSGGDFNLRYVDTDFHYLGWEICVVNAGGSHDGLTAEYAAITKEMGEAAQFFGKNVLSEVDEAEFYASISDMRNKVSDRAIVRAMHFYTENARVLKQLTALKNYDIGTYRELMLESGHSSYEKLQNVYPSGNENERSLSLALGLSEHILSGKGAWRVHGGGFAGTIQALVPLDLLDEYVAQMEAVFGAGSVYRLRIRNFGGYCFDVV